MKLKRLIMIILTICFALNLIIPSGLIFANSGSLTFNFTSGDFTIKPAENNYQEIKMEGFQTMNVPGAPRLPVKNYTIILPPRAKFSSLEIIEKEQKSVAGNYKIKFGLPMAMATDKIPSKNGDYPPMGEDKKIYDSNKQFPEKIINFIHQGKMRKWNLANISFVPMIYFPKSGKIIQINKVVVKINYDVKESVSQVELADTVANEAVKEVAINYPSAQPTYQAGKRQSINATYHYLFIIKDGLDLAITPLKNYKQSLGLSCKVENISWINANIVEDDLAAKIRKYLADNYLAWGLQYVLLVGSVADIPMRNCYPNPANHATQVDEMPIPTDYYYADLNGDWDSENGGLGDGFYGEYGDDDVDFYRDVDLGRIPVSDEATVTSICNKIVSFSQDTGAWKKNALLLGAIMNYYKEWYPGFIHPNHSNYPKTDGATLMENMKTNILSPKGFSYYTEYEKEGLAGAISTYACDIKITSANVHNRWEANNYGVVNWMGHGSRREALRKTYGAEIDGDGWSDGDRDCDPNPGIPVTENKWDPFIRHTDTTYLNAQPAIVFAASCLNGYPEDTNLATELLKKGAVAIVAASRSTYYTLGWSYSEDSGLASLSYYFNKYMISDGKRVGVALKDADFYYSSNLFNYGPYWQHQLNLFAYNLYGDPHMPLLGEGAAPPPPPNPPQGAVLINQGTANTTNPLVNLTLTASGSNSVTQMIISNSATFTGASWESYQTSKEWILSSGTSTKTVYAKFKDNTGLISSPASDSINLSKASYRYAGDDRYLTAVDISQHGWTKATTAVLARGDLFPDALAGAPLASKAGGPILLTDPGGLRKCTKDEINRLDVQSLYVLGSEDALYPAVIDDLIAQCGINPNQIVRLGGDTRYDTANLIAQKVGLPTNKTAILAYGENYPDALSAASYAATLGMPIFLTGSESVPTQTLQTIVNMGITHIYIMGGTDVVSQSIEDMFKDAHYGVDRFAGATRYETCISLASYAITHGLYPYTEGIAYGENFPDALSLGPLLAKYKAPILLVRTSFIPQAISVYLNNYKADIYQIITAGGSDVVSDAVVKQIEDLIGI